MPTIRADALTTLERAKLALDYARDNKDGLITMLINQATGLIQRHCRRAFKRATYSAESYVGDGTKWLILKQFPVASVTSIGEAQNAVESDPGFTTLDSDNYRVYADGRVERLDGVWLEGYAYQVTYVAGYLIAFASEADTALHTLPEDLELACQKLVGRVFNRRKAEGISSTSQGETSVTLGPGSIDPEIRELLAPHVAHTL